MDACRETFSWLRLSPYLIGVVILPGQVVNCNDIVQVNPPNPPALLEDSLPSSQRVEIGTPIQSPSTESPCPSEVSTPLSVPNSLVATAVLPNNTVNFTIPSKWRPSIMRAIDEKKINT